jgi:hypothetical protein
MQPNCSAAGTILPHFRFVPARSVDAFVKTFGAIVEGGVSTKASTSDGVACILMDKSAAGAEAATDETHASPHDIEFKLSGAHDRDVMLTLIDVKQGHRDVLLGECFIPLAALMLGIKSRGHYHFCIPTTTQVCE